ncbi:MAG: transposase [Planctomycetaceae bacterium]
MTAGPVRRTGLVRTATTAPLPTQDEDKSKHYRDRWQIERSISWLHRFRRLVVRYERYDDLFLGFLQLACLFTTIQRL